MRKVSPKPPPATPTQEPAREGGSRASTTVALAVACHLVGGCASTPTGGPEYVPCPPNSWEVMGKEFGIDHFGRDEVYMPGNTKGDDFKKSDYVVISEGPGYVVVRGGGLWAKVPPGTKLLGEFYYRDKLYGRFYEMELPNKQRYPYCGQLWDAWGFREGMEVLPGSKPGAIRVHPVATVAAAKFAH